MIKAEKIQIFTLNLTIISEYQDVEYEWMTDRRILIKDKDSEYIYHLGNTCIVEIKLKV